VIVVDEYLAVRSLLGDLPDEVPDEPLALTASAHWRLLQRVHAPGWRLALTSPVCPHTGWSRRHPPAGSALLEVLDPRPLLDEAAQIAARYGNTGSSSPRW
jgi:hypothetical protein